MVLSASRHAILRWQSRSSFRKENRAIHKRHMAVLVLILFASVATAQNNAPVELANQPVEPFRIAGNLYYVGDRKSVV